MLGSTYKMQYKIQKVNTETRELGQVWPDLNTRLLAVLTQKAQKGSNTTPASLEKHWWVIWATTQEVKIHTHKKHFQNTYTDTYSYTEVKQFISKPF